MAGLGAALDGLTSGCWWALSEGELAAAVVELHRLESRVAAAQVGALAEAISRGVPTTQGAINGAAWLRGLVPVTPSQARARAELAEALPPAAWPPQRRRRRPATRALIPAIRWTQQMRTART